MQSIRADVGVEQGSAGLVRKLTVLHVAAPAAVGGLERVVEALAHGQGQAGHSVHVAAVLEPASGAHPFVERLRRAGVDVIELRVGARAYHAERMAMAGVCARLRPDIVHTHGYRPDVVDAGVARRAGVACVTTVHGFTATTARGHLYEWLQRRSFRRFDAVVAVSRPQRDGLLAAGVPADRLHLVPNAWAGLPDPPLPQAEARARLGLPVAGPVVGWVGRLTEEKGPDLFLEALASVSDLPWWAGVVGSGRMGTRLRALAEALGIGERVRWLGQLPDAGRLLTAFDLLVMSSRTEGTPILLFEAMAAGVPLVSTAVGGIPEVVRPEEAWLAARAPGALGETLRAALMEPDGSAARAAAASRRLADFAPGPWLAAYEHLYRSVARGAAKGDSP